MIRTLLSGATENRVDPPPAAAVVSPLRPQHVERSRKLSRHLETATRLLQATLRHELAAADVFDVELMGDFLAIAELWGAQHALEWRSLRFYYNPLTARLEPIGHAAELQHPHRGIGLATGDAPFAARLLADPRIRSAFDRSLRRIAGEMDTEAFAAALAEQERGPLRSLHREYPLRAPFDAGPLRQRAAKLRDGAAGATSVGPERFAAAASDRPAIPLPTPELAATLALHPFLTWDAAERALRAAPGRWNVKGSLILPEGVGLTLPAGTILRFQPREGLIARGAAGLPRHSGRTGGTGGTGGVEALADVVGRLRGRVGAPVALDARGGPEHRRLQAEGVGARRGGGLPQDPRRARPLRPHAHSRRRCSQHRSLELRAPGRDDRRCALGRLRRRLRRTGSVDRRPPSNAPAAMPSTSAAPG